MRSISAVPVCSNVSSTSSVAGLVDVIVMASSMSAGARCPSESMITPVALVRNARVGGGVQGSDVDWTDKEAGMKASALIVRCLENEGVQYVFGVPGEEILDIVDSLVDSSIRFIPTRHEQGAAFMADAYGRLTGRAGVCLSTLGQGETNWATASRDREWIRDTHGGAH